MWRGRSALFSIGLLLGAAPNPEPFPLDRFVEAEPGMDRRIAVDGTWIDIAETSCGAQRLGHPACFGDADGDTRYLVAMVRSRDGAPPLRITSDPGLGFRYAVGRLSPHDPHPSLVILTDAGGSGGCVSIQIAYAEPKGFAAARLNHGAAGIGNATFCRVDPVSRVPFPTDRSGHGTADFVLADDRFDCGFGSCASTWAPPRVFAFDHGTSRDVSADPNLKSLFADDAVKARAACENTRNPEPKGACIAYVADASRIGAGAEAMAVLRRRIGGAPVTRCTQFEHTEPARCLAETRYRDFADEAEAVLDRLGYPILSAVHRSTS